MNRERKCRVLLIYRTMIPSVRLCGHCQMEELDRQGKIEYRACQELRLTNQDMNWADIVLLGRLDSWYEFQLAKKLKESGKYLIYIIDDDLLNIPSQISSAAYYGQKSIQGYICGMIEMCDAILSPSPILLEKYAVNGRRGIQIEEPAIDPITYAEHNSSKPVKIGFAGSIDRTGDVESLLKDVLIDIKMKYGDQVEFEFFGALPSFADAIRAKQIAYCNSYDEYRKQLNDLKWDIGLAPMPDTAFHACKHYNKFVEYASAGIVGIFSDVQPYVRIHDFFKEVVLCENHRDAWNKTLCDLIEDTQKRERLRSKACTLAAGVLSVEQVSVNLFEKMQQEFLIIGKDSDVQYNLLFYKTVGFVLRVKNKIKRMLFSN